MLMKEMKIGKSVEIYVDRDGYRYRIVSKIEDVQRDNVSISLIASREKVFQFKEYDKVEVLYKDNERLWKWRNLKGSIKSLENIKVHNLALTTLDEEGKIYNRRDAYRVFVGEAVQVKYYVLNPEYIEYKEHPERASDYARVEQYLEKQCEGYIKDISENGVGIFLNQTFELESELEFTFQSEYGEFYCKAVVNRITEEEQGKYKDFYGCLLKESSKDLLKYIFNKQRLQLLNIRKTVYHEK